MNFQALSDWGDIKGFLADSEAEALFSHGGNCARLGPLLEICSYCGKSTICLGLAAREADSVVFALDHHRGSEEHQLGEMFHDKDLYDSGSGQMDTFREFRANIDRAGLTNTVIPVVATSELAARQWSTPLAMVFIDGGHSLDAALCDYRAWAPKVLCGGVLAIHDVYPDAAEGGQAPYAIYCMARESGFFRELERVESLAILERIA